MRENQFLKKAQRTICKEKRTKKPIFFSINIVCKENKGEAVRQRFRPLLDMVSRIFFWSYFSFYLFSSLSDFLFHPVLFLFKGCWEGNERTKGERIKLGAPSNVSSFLALCYKVKLLYNPYWRGFAAVWQHKCTQQDTIPQFVSFVLQATWGCISEAPQAARMLRTGLVLLSNVRLREKISSCSLILIQTTGS